MSVTHQRAGSVDIYQPRLEDLLMMTETIFGEKKHMSIAEQLKKASLNLKNVLFSVLVGRRDSTSSKGSTKHSDDAKRDR